MTNKEEGAQSTAPRTKKARIALLVADTPIPAVLKQQGDYEAIFTRLFEASRPADVPAFRMDAFDVKKGEYPPESILDEYLGVVITGSASSAYEDVEWINKLVIFVKRLALTTHVIKIIGICFGHQIVARAFGGDNAVVPNGGKWEVGVEPVKLTTLGKRIFGTDADINIQEMHRDHVPSLPPAFHLLGSTDVSKNQGMVRFAYKAPEPGPTEALPPIHIFTVQGHPEFTKEIVHELVEARSKSGILDTKTADQARKRAEWRNDGVHIGRVIWAILKQ
ncbi:class I glutamine amidotransferase-like protein [Peniophora sp. CONT]|nr:class I glutamine amidotransferase-like protein [Peniophora sp. CONT]